MSKRGGGGGGERENIPSIYNPSVATSTTAHGLSPAPKDSQHLGLEGRVGTFHIHQGHESSHTHVDTKHTLRLREHRWIIPVHGCDLDVEIKMGKELFQP